MLNMADKANIVVAFLRPSCLAGTEQEEEEDDPYGLLSQSQTAPASPWEGRRHQDGPQLDREPDPGYLGGGRVQDVF